MSLHGHAFDHLYTNSFDSQASQNTDYIFCILHLQFEGPFVEVLHLTRSVVCGETVEPNYTGFYTHCLEKILLCMERLLTMFSLKRNGRQTKKSGKCLFALAFGP